MDWEGSNLEIMGIFNFRIGSFPFSCPLKNYCSIISLVAFGTFVNAVVVSIMLIGQLGFKTSVLWPSIMSRKNSHTLFIICCLSTMESFTSNMCATPTLYCLQAVIE